MKIRYLFLFCTIFLLSCTSIQIADKSTTIKHERGVWHRVKEGQTLWRIAKTYRVELDAVKEANDIEDVVHIAQGTWIFIPGAKKHLWVQGNVESTPEGEAKLDFVWPTVGEIVRSYGKDKTDFNYGIDINLKGNENIVATQSGKVVLSGKIRGYGNTVIIEHENNFCSLYAKNLRVLVKEGQTVKKNQVIGKPELMTGGKQSIVHYELFHEGKSINPLYYLP
jgi:murein DD-endopeptidase MepM/ murein hydrolase activator NlpD